MHNVYKFHNRKLQRVFDYFQYRSNICIASVIIKQESRKLYNCSNPCFRVPSRISHARLPPGTSDKAYYSDSAWFIVRRALITLAKCIPKVDAFVGHRPEWYFDDEPRFSIACRVHESTSQGQEEVLEKIETASRTWFWSGQTGVFARVRK